MTPSDTLRQSVADAMTRQNVSQSELARHTGLTQPAISRYLSGGKDLTGASLDRLLAALGLTVRELRRTRSTNAR